MTEIMKKVYENGVLVETIDTRTLEGEKARRIAVIKAKTGEDILAAYPTYKQQNAALGLYSAEETQAIKDGIQALRIDCDSKEALVNACTSLSQLDGLFL